MKTTYKISLFIVTLLALGSHVYAAGAGGAGLPWEAPLTTLSNSVSGPVAYGLSILGIVGVGGFLIFAGGMLGDFLRAVLFVVLVISMVIAGKTTLTAFGFAAGAEVTKSEVVYGVATSHNP